MDKDEQNSPKMDKTDQNWSINKKCELDVQNRNMDDLEKYVKTTKRIELCISF